MRSRIHSVVCRYAGVVFGAIFVGLVASGFAVAKDPELPPNEPPQGLMVAVVGDGVDYTRPDITARIARDGEAVLVGWDFVDDDGLPFAKSSTGSEFAARLIAQAPMVSLALVRENPVAVGNFGSAVGFSLQTPASVIVATNIDGERPDWRLLGLMARDIVDRIILVRPGPEISGRPFAGASGLPTVLRVGGLNAASDTGARDLSQADIWVDGITSLPGSSASVSNVNIHAGALADVAAALSRLLQRAAAASGSVGSPSRQAAEAALAQLSTGLRLTRDGQTRLVHVDALAKLGAGKSN